jgi:glutamate-ammonia-ligase adenylyltransferase
MHLARRAGYTGRGRLSPAEELRVEFETRTAEVRAFVEEQLGKEALPGDVAGNIADVVVTEHMESERFNAILSPAGFRDTERAYRNLKSLAGSGERRYRFAEVAILAWDFLVESPDPGMALNNWEQFVHAAGNATEHFTELVSQPKRLEVLLAIFAGSQFLSNTLIRNPEFFAWATSPDSVWTRRTGEDYRRSLGQLRSESGDRSEWLNALRRFRKQEILRIGTRDICLNVSIHEVMAELSSLASEIVRHATTAVLDRLDVNASARERLCVLAFGKLGARELNYSSDIDLVGVYRVGGGGTADAAESTDAAAPSREDDLRIFAGVMKHLRSDLSDHMEEGYVYRVDLRLRPFGSASPIAQTLDAVVSYYESSAAPWEQQALLRLRPVAGSRAVGEELLHRLREPFFATWQHTDVRAEIRGLRETAVDHHTGARGGTDIKNGIGGLRDVEFLVQGLQILHSRGYPELLLGNTLDAITILEERSIIPEETAGFLTETYSFLRRIEHFLQMLEDRQVHRLPGDDEAQGALGRRIEQAEQLERPFETVLEERMKEVRRLFTHYMGGA